MGWGLVLCSVSLQLVAIAIFSAGFFPQPKSRRIEVELAREEIVDEGGLGRCGDAMEQLPEHLVLVVVDALRYGFLHSMAKTNQMFTSGRATALRVHVHSPTVTLPRIKAIVSGIVPTFSDVVWNLASTEHTEDNWLRRARVAGKRIVFYGDDTWMKMFPKSATAKGGVFEERSEGVSSFFVTDYTEVDENVTRHLAGELSEEGLSGWDVMILHYLGLDHVGHSLGGDHPQIALKLTELDDLIVEIARKLEARGKEFVLLVTGDHGMTDRGNHGGSSPDETQVPLIVIRPSRNSLNSTVNYTLAESEVDIEQIDMAPTISALLGLNPPANNAGVSFLSQLPYSWHVVAAGLHSNAKEFIELMDAHLSSEENESLRECIGNVETLCASTLAELPLEHRELHLVRCEVVLRRIQTGWLDQVDTYDDNYIALGASLAAASLALTIVNLIIGSGGQTFRTMSTLPFLLIAAQHLLLFSSSYIEEEHDIWYFLLPLLVMHHAFAMLRRGRRGRTEGKTATPALPLAIVILALHRISRSYSESSRRRWKLFGSAGDKTIEWMSWNGTESIPFEVAVSWVATLSSLACPIILIGLLFYAFSTRRMSWRSTPSAVCIVALCTLKGPFSALFRPHPIESAVQLALAWLGLLREFSHLITLWLLFVAKPSVYPLIALCGLVGYAIGKLTGKSEAADIVLMLYAAMASAFFYQGNANDISTVDISSAYAGFSSYQPVLVAVQLLLNTYLGPIAVFVGWYEAIRQDDAWRESLNANLSFLLTIRSSTMLITMISLYLHRYHLFIHSVFAPKFLFEVAHFCTASLFIVLIKLRTGFAE